MSAPCLLTPHGFSASTCGYCSPSGSRSAGPTSKKYGLEASQMSAQFYQDMIDRGWRRSGDYVYHPDMQRTCCPQYTIRLESLEFKPDKKHRQVMNRFNRYLTNGEKPGEGADTEGKGKGKGKRKGKGNETGDWLETLHSYQEGYQPTAGKHKFETVLTPAISTPETFVLYKRYQVAVHKDKPGDVSQRGFSRFLCDSPIGDQSINYSGNSGTKDPNLPDHYGSYHLLYKVDGQLVGISVIDILPACVSSVYFIWDPDWAWASLGKLSAMHEVALSLEMNRAGAEGMRYLYMGYWIANCVKMRYKSEYSPSFLLDPGTNIFNPLTVGLDRFLQAHPSGYHPFAEIPPDWKDDKSKPAQDVRMNNENENTEEDEGEVEQMDEFPSTPPPGFADPSSYTEDEIDRLVVLMKGGIGRKSRVVPLGALQFVQPEAVTSQVREMVAAVGLDLMAEGSSLGRMKDKGILFFG